MAVGGKAGAAFGLTVAVASLAACIAADVEVIGAVGVTVDQNHRPVVVVEACEAAATEVDLVFDREGLTDDEENEQVASWFSDAPVPGTSELVLHAPASPWAGKPIDVLVDRGYIATAVGVEDSQVLSQVAFRGRDLADMQPGTVYTNDSNADVLKLIGRTTESFTADVCGRG
jgi:hypothetical protein